MLCCSVFPMPPSKHCLPIACLEAPCNGTSDAPSAVSSEDSVCREDDGEEEKDLTCFDLRESLLPPHFLPAALGSRESRGGHSQPKHHVAVFCFSPSLPCSSSLPRRRRVSACLAQWEVQQGEDHETNDGGGLQGFGRQAAPTRQWHSSSVCFLPGS